MIIFQRRPTMVCNSVLMDFWTLSFVWYSKEHNVSETVSVSVYFRDYNFGSKDDARGR
jgi:hypothetical protein